MRQTRPNRTCGNTIQNAASALVIAMLAGSAGCGPMSFLITPVSGARKLVESEVSRDGAWATQKIALLDVDGVLTNVRGSSFFSGESDNPVAEFKEKLDKAADDGHVKAVVVRINSPGGGVTASDLMYEELSRFREKTGKPVVASMLDVAASGGYYIACAADRIIAHPTTVTGSIGVIMIAPDLSGTMQKIGLRTNVIKSGVMKDAGSPFREMGEQDRAVFQKLIDAMYERFLDVVSRGRPGVARERLREIADGRIYVAREARQLGLVDEIGTLRDAIDAAKGLAGIANRKIIVVQYARPASYRPNIYARGGEQPAQVNVFNVKLPAWLTADGAPQFMYLWAPGW